MLIVLSLLAAAADPETPSPARLCADAAAGNEVDICLQLAAQYPDEVDGIAAALRAHIDRGSAPDRDLLAGLLLLLSPDTAIVGVTTLADSGDPRAVPPLVNAARTRDDDIGIAAVKALGRFPEALEPLSAFLLDPDVSIEVRIEAVHVLAGIGGDEAGDVLHATVRRRGVPIPLRQALLDELESSYPDLYATLDRPVGVDGSAWVAIGAGFGLGYTLYATADVGQSDLAVYGAGAGALAGGTAGFLAGRAWPIEAADASFATSIGTTGIVGGHLIGSAFIGPEGVQSRRSALVGGLTGGATGYSLGVAFSGHDPGTVGDQFEATLFGSAVGLGIGSALQERRLDVRPTIVPAQRFGAGLGLVAGAGLGHFLAHRVHLSPADGGTVLFSTGLGAFAGALVPPGEDKRRWPLPITGGCAGGLLGYGLASFTEPRPDVVLGTMGGLGFGAASGVGVGLLIEPDGELGGAATSTGALIGGVGGAVVGNVVSSRDTTPPDAADALLVTLGTGWAAWQTIGWGKVIAPNKGAGGYAWLVPAATGGTVGLLTPRLDVAPRHALAATSLGLWGGYVLGASATLAGEPSLPYALVGSDIGLVTGGLLESPLVSTPPLVIGLADAGGVLGGSAAALGAGLFSRDPKIVLGASLGGAGVGFVGGAVLGGSLKGRTRDQAFLLPDVPGRWMIAPTMVYGETAAPGVAIGATGW